MKLLFIFILLTGVFFNSTNTYIRLLDIALWLSIPFLVLIIQSSKIPCREQEWISLFLLFYFFFFMSYLLNIDTLSFDISGPAVEKLTPFLFIPSMAVWFMYKDKSLRLNDPSIVGLFYILLTSALIFEALYRGVVYPEFFMDYDNRQAAKTVGWFSTTNVTGQIIALFISISWFLKFKNKEIIQTILLLILITTMARASIIALFVGYALYQIFYIKSKFMIIVTAALLFYVALENPLNIFKDGSLLSKFDFIYRVLDIIRNSDLKNILFGYGASYSAVVNLLDVSGWSPHLPILKAFLYYGVFGVLFYFFTFLYIYYHNKTMLLPLLIFAILSMAGAPIFWPTLFVGLIILSINQKSI
jgi:hypothetical protein